MLKALYDYALRYDLALPAGFVNKTIKAYLSLTDDPDYIQLRLGDKEAVPCPDVGSLANGKDKSNVLVEKRSVVVPPQPTLKSQFFLSALREGGQFEPMLAICARTLADPAAVARIIEMLDREKIKDGDRISFLVNGRSILASEQTKAWWLDFRRQFLKTNEGSLCLITGQPASPMTTTPPVQGLYAVGGHGRGDALIAFDKPSFCSYDLKKALNAPVAEESFAVVKAALDDLLADAPILAGMKFVHWYDKTVPPEQDPLIYCGDFGLAAQAEEDDEDEETESAAEQAKNARIARRQADKLVESVHSGEAPLLPEAISYYILLLTGVNGRIMIRRYEQGNYWQLRQRLELWHEDLRLVNSAGTAEIKSCKLTARLIRLLKHQNSDRKVFKRLADELAGVTPAVLTAILTGGPLPDAVAVRSLAYIRAQMYADGGDEQQSGPPVPDGWACQWLKVWLLRKNRKAETEVSLMTEYNYQLENPAYHCGGLMAVYAAIQAYAMKNVNAGIVQRYYASASRTPALVLGQLARLANYHLDKIDYKTIADSYSDKLQTISLSIGQTIPVTLSLEEQSYFALGYYQQWAELNREKMERFVDAEQRKADKKNQATEGQNHGH